jgi:RNA polymerase sigma factor (sigma-70 family)
VVENAGMTVRGHDRLEDVYRTQAEHLWRALVLHTGDRDRASDAVSEAFAQALRRGDAIHDPERWIWKTAFLLADRQRFEERGNQLDIERQPPFEEPSVDLLDVLVALHRLTPHQRASIVLHHYVGYSLREVAGIIGSTRAAVGVHLFRGREQLRKELRIDDE